MGIYRSKKIALPIVSLAAMMMLSACGGSSDGDSSDSDSSTESNSEVETGVGAMADAGFAVTVLLETIWPIDGNDYAEPALVEPWCATYATDPNAAILSVTEYLSSEPDIAAADPESVASATDEYLDGNCYLLDE
ncbi:MAG: hypothetical protein OR995_04615 [Candidatus Nanopelagicales bacterium]|nr:hypothetical protein [Candidatus Nanopelagicales bacterium]